MIRKNIVLSDTQFEWIKQKSKEIGVPQTSIISMAISQYIDQQTALRDLSNLEKLISDIKELKK